jgi:hypothetical protein
MLVFSAASAQSYRLLFPSGKRFVLPVALASSLLSQCSRPTPEGATNFFEPTQAELDELETRLPAYLDSGVSGEFPPRMQYHRQYIGFVKGGARYVYGSFYFGGEQILEGERTRAIVVCDGGATFWGIVYSIDRGEFSELSFNGPT